MKNVKGKKIENIQLNEGHWLETKMKIKHNGKNEPDIYGYEMKKQSPKITFGDFSASKYLFTKSPIFTRNDFIRNFGKSNPMKNGRYSWSGSCVPSYNEWNEYGQMIHHDEEKNLCISYSFERDTRLDKYENRPKFLQTDHTIIAIWKKDKLKINVERKFNHRGFFICKKINDTYEKICFGKPFDYEHFNENIMKKNIIFDSGMYEGNPRNYSLFRSKMSDFWENLITEEYS